MSRYIDADALIKRIQDEHKFGSLMLSNMIAEMPTADVVEVVRCENCKHAEIQDYAPPSCRYCCKYSALYHAKNFYCSMGERREE